MGMTMHETLNVSLHTNKQGGRENRSSICARNWLPCRSMMHQGEQQKGAAIWGP